MQREVKIGDKAVNMRSSASTAIRYRNLFHEDIMKAIATIDPKDFDTEMVGKVQKLGFLMAMSADGADLKSLTEDDYIDWLDQFETVDMMNATGDIVRTYLGQKVTIEKGTKKKTARQGK